VHISAPQPTSKQVCNCHQNLADRDDSSKPFHDCENFAQTLTTRPSYCTLKEAGIPIDWTAMTRFATLTDAPPASGKPSKTLPLTAENPFDQCIRLARNRLIVQIYDVQNTVAG
jgi:hypothetical protein